MQIFKKIILAVFIVQMIKGEFKMVVETGSECREETPAYVHSFVRDMNGGKFVEDAYGIETLYEAMEVAEREYGDMRFLGRIREDGSIKYFTYKEVREAAKNIACALCDRIQAESGQLVVIGICSDNMPEWIIAEHATYFFSGVNCPIYPSFGWSAMKHIFDETKMEILFISGKNAEKIADRLGKEREEEEKTGKKFAGFLPKLLILMDKEPTEKARDIIGLFGIKLERLADLTCSRQCPKQSIQEEGRLKAASGEVSDFPGRQQKGEDSRSSTLRRRATEQKRKEAAGEGGQEKVKEEKTQQRERPSSASVAHQKFKAPGPGTIATICYTSGTTGLPKGAMLTHKNFVSVAGSFLNLSRAEAFFPIKDENRYLSFLPLAHVFERIVESTLLMSRCTIIYYRGNPKELANDFGAARPHYFIGVPRVFNSIKTAIETAAREKGRVADFVFRTAVALCSRFKSSIFRELVGRAVFKEVRHKFGGSIECMLSGSAPLSAEISDFFEAIFNKPFFEGYGQTETAAGNITTTLGTTEKEVIGIPFPCNRVKLVSRPESDAIVENNQGEILLQGPSIFLGYFKNAKLTAETFYQRKDGKEFIDTENPYNTNGERWIKTGDIGEITEHGNLKIIGRSKDIFKLSQGEYIVPEKIENLLMQKVPQGVLDIIIVGHTDKDYVIAVCVIEKGMDQEEIKKHVLGGARELLAHNEVIKIEIPRAFVFTDEPLTIDNELLTPSAKKVRSKILSKYADRIDLAYRSKPITI